MLHANLSSVFTQLQDRTAQSARASAPQAYTALAQLSVGQAVTATIIARLDSGLLLADIGGQQVQLAMPLDASPGETLSLRVLKLEPEPAFEFLGTTRPAVAPPPTLSQAAQLIQTVLAGAAPTPIKSAAPLAEPSALAAPTGPEQLAGVLRRAIEESGVFYESHLAAWTQGQRPLTQLQREPQAKWNVLQNLPYLSGTAAAEIGRQNQDGAHALLQRGDDWMLRTIELPEQARPILRQQLEALESAKILWNGQVWHGQAAAIAIAEETSQRAHDSAPPTWRTALTLALPSLGDIRADLAVRGEMLTISIDCNTRDSARRLQSELTGLGKSLQTAGLVPLSLTVTGHA
jgi:hypothetical protein